MKNSEKKMTLKGLLILGCLFSYFFYGIVTADKKPVDVVLECLDKWNRHLKQHTKEIIRDPGSFKPINTTIISLKDGYHTIIMNYRAKNGYGGMSSGSTGAHIKLSNCSLIEIF